MQQILSYRDLEVWKRSRRMVKGVYDITESFPQNQRLSLCQQMQRAAVSVPSNIAEGQVKRATRDYIRHLNIALGSLAELDTQILLSTDLGYIDNAKASDLCEECAIIARMLNKLASSLNNHVNGSKPLKPEAQSLEPNLCN